MSQNFMQPADSLPHSQELCIFPYPWPDQSIPQPSLYLQDLHVTIHLRLGLPSDLFLSGFPTSNLHAVLFSPTRPTCQFSLIPFDLITNYISPRVQITRLLIMQFPTPFGHFIPRSSKYFPSIVLLNKLSLCSSLNVRNQVSCPYKTTGKFSSHGE
jgi:hypothetical protein